MARLPQQRKSPHLGPSDTSDTPSDRPGEPATDTDDAGTGERPTVGTNPRSELHSSNPQPALLLLLDCFGLSRGESAEILRNMQRRRR